MSFDVNNPDHRLELKSEVEDDPLGMDYGVVPKNIVDKINSKSLNLSTATIATPFEELYLSIIIESVNSQEYSELSEYDKEWVKSLMYKDMLDQLIPYLNKFFSVFRNTNTLQKFQALRSRKASRGEELWGHGTIITEADWIASRV